MKDGSVGKTCSSILSVVSGGDKIDITVEAVEAMVDVVVGAVVDSKIV
jgi:hypothetical protein